MKRALPSLLIGFAIPFLMEAGAAEEKFEGKGLRATMRSEASTIAPGQTFIVALTLSHHPGYHSYWKNPGTVGMPTGIKWELPKGFEAGELIWQIPERSKMFKYDVYGYETNATLLTEIKAPQNLAQDSIVLRAKASWMACNDSSCNPGYHTFELKLPVSEKTAWARGTRELVKAAQARLPKPIPALQATASAKGNKIRLQIEGKPIQALLEKEGLYFFSMLNHYKIDPEQKIRLKKGILTVTLSKTDYAPDKIDRVKGILRFPVEISGKDSSFALIETKLD